MIFQTFFHSGQMDQIQHLAPVHRMIGLNGPGCIPDCFFYELHLFDAVLDQLELQIQRIQHKMVIGIADGHFADIFQGEAEIFEQQNLLEPCEVFIGIKAGAGFGNPGRF